MKLACAGVALIVTVCVTVQPMLSVMVTELTPAEHGPADMVPPLVLVVTVPVGPVVIAVNGSAPAVKVPVIPVKVLEHVGCIGVICKFGAGVIVTVILRMIG